MMSPQKAGRYSAASASSIGVHDSRSVSVRAVIKYADEDLLMRSPLLRICSRVGLRFLQFGNGFIAVIADDERQPVLDERRRRVAEQDHNRQRTKLAWPPPRCFSTVLGPSVLDNRPAFQR